MLAWFLPNPNKVPANTYRANKLVTPFMMGVERIHACPNHYILYHGDTFKDLNKCLVCSVSRYKNSFGYCVVTFKVHVMGIKGRGRVQGIVLPPLGQQTLL
jgi:hypothetical protein